MHPSFSRIPSPAYVVDLGKLEENLRALADVRDRAGCKIVLALKGFAMWSTAPLVRRYLDGVCASGAWEARLGREEFGGEVLTYSPAYTEEDITEILSLTDHLDFNSVGQWLRFRDQVLGAEREVLPGLRINPECSTQPPEHAIYDPCSPGSRLGATADGLAAVSDDDWRGIRGLHFHTLCEQDTDALEATLAAVEEKFGQWLPRLEYFNMGGGHHITRPGYDREHLVKLVRDFAERYDVTVYLEPGEAVALDAGYLIATVLDVLPGDPTNVILDVSATAHMPDVLEMPYRPRIEGGGEPAEKAHTYRLGGSTCLAGDIIGDWSFDTPLEVGDRLVFHDMAHYTMVKTTTFNGVKHPSIVTFDPGTGATSVQREFTYEDYRNRLS